MITELLPEIDEIKDEKLRQKVIDVWEEAMEFRGWTPEVLKSIPFTLLAENVKVTFIDHVRAVCKICIAVDKVLEEVHGSKRTPVNRDYLIAGALLADVGKLLEYEIVNGKPIKSDYGKKLRHPRDEKLKPENLSRLSLMSQCHMITLLQFRRRF